LPVPGIPRDRQKKPFLCDLCDFAVKHPSLRGQNKKQRERPLLFGPLDPFDGAKPRLSRRRWKMPLRVNPEQTPALMPGSRRVDVCQVPR
jgi:hypothetical protein